MSDLQGTRVGLGSTFQIRGSIGCPLPCRVAKMEMYSHDKLDE